MAQLLIVDDELAHRRIATMMCERAGHTVRQAANGEEAWDLLRANDFDLAVVDMVMPGLSGVELVARIRATPETARMPVLGLTAALAPDNRRALAEAGVSLVVGKPFSRHALSSAIDVLLG
jgi:CheY-like chemotaxis protein